LTELRGTDRRCGRGPIRRVRDGVGRAVSGDHSALAHLVGAVHPVPRVPAGDPQGHLHHERGREPERPVPPGGATTGAFPEWALCAQGALPGHPQPGRQPHERDRPHDRREGCAQPRRQDIGVRRAGSGSSLGVTKQASADVHSVSCRWSEHACDDDRVV